MPWEESKVQEDKTSVVASATKIMAQDHASEALIFREALRVNQVMSVVDRVITTFYSSNTYAVAVDDRRLAQKSVQIKLYAETTSFRGKRKPSTC